MAVTFTRAALDWDLLAAAPAQVLAAGCNKKSSRCPLQLPCVLMLAASPATSLCSTSTHGFNNAVANQVNGGSFLVFRLQQNQLTPWSPWSPWSPFEGRKKHIPAILYAGSSKLQTGCSKKKISPPTAASRRANSCPPCSSRPDARC